MRKFLAIALTSLYLIGTAGVVLNKRSCCGQQLGLQLLASEHGCCDHSQHQCTVKSKDCCCSFEIVFYSVEDEHMAFVPDVDVDAVAIRQMVIQSSAIEHVEENKVVFPDTPDPPKLPHYITCSSLILYA